MTQPLPTLSENGIRIDADTAVATASLVFADETEISIHIGWETLRAWAISSKQLEIKAAILEHYETLALLAMQARASGATVLALL